MVPLQLHRLLHDSPDGIAQLNRIDNLLLGGAEVRQSLRECFNGLRCRIYHSYGMTETVSHIAIRELYPDYQPDFEVLPGVQLELDQRGCLVIHAPLLDVSGLCTNDRVELTNNRQFHWLGRYDNMLNSGGIKVFPESLENLLEPLLTEREFIIGKRWDEKLGEAIVLFIEGEPMSAAQMACLQRAMAQRLSRYQRPRAIYFVPQFERTDSGKVRRLNYAD